MNKSKRQHLMHHMISTRRPGIYKSLHKIGKANGIRKIVRCNYSWFWVGKSPIKKFRHLMSAKAYKERLEVNWHRYINGEFDEGFQQLLTGGDIQLYIGGQTGRHIKNIRSLELGKKFPNNPDNPYSHDTWYIEMQDGAKFKLERQYGRPAWDGKVNWVERISISF